MIKANDSNKHFVNERITLDKYLAVSHSALIDSYRKDKILMPYLFSEKSLYLLKYDYKYAGYCYLIEVNYYPLNDRLMLSWGLTKPYRSNYEEQKPGIGTYVLTSISDYFLNNANYLKLGLDINKENVASIKCATKSGYKIDYLMWEKYEHEGYRYIPYVKIRQK